MTNALSNLEPKSVFHYFGELSGYPRPSKKEEKAVAYVEKWAAERNFEVQKDKRGNLIIRKPATKGMENRQSVCLQGHIDMVCVAEEGYDFDFDNKGIEVYTEEIDNELYVRAKRTTLGADNGIAIAMGMALLDSKDIPHPDIELLCTLDEETGLTGALELGTDLIKSSLLINIDSEKEGVFTIGCAGGINTIARYKYEADTVPNNITSYSLNVGGLKGGHSGIEIHDGRANASKLLTRLLWTCIRDFGAKISTFDGGTKHNAIPSSATAIIVVPNENVDKFEKFIAEMSVTMKKEFATKERNLKVELEKSATPYRVMTDEFQKRLLNSFYAVPHGVLRMSPDIPELVQSSSNFAIVETHENEIYVLTSQRSSVDSEKINVVHKVISAFELGGAVVETTDGYPAWEPNVKSKLLDLAKEVYEKKFGKKPLIEAIHAGLECGLIGDKYENMDMLSIGPNLYDVHSPDERLHVQSTQKVWEFLLELMKNIPSK